MFSEIFKNFGEKPENTREITFKEGQFIKVRRSSGEIEDDWKVVALNNEQGTVVVVKEVQKDQKKETYRKEISLKDVEKYNPDLVQKKIWPSATVGGRPKVEEGGTDWEEERKKYL